MTYLLYSFKVENRKTKEPFASLRSNKCQHPIQADFGYFPICKLHPVCLFKLLRCFHLKKDHLCQIISSDADRLGNKFCYWSLRKRFGSKSLFALRISLLFYRTGFTLIFFFFPKKVLTVFDKASVKSSQSNSLLLDLEKPRFHFI